MTPEHKVKAKVKKWYEAWSAWSFAPVSNGMGVMGIPDRIGCLPVVVTQQMVGKRIGLFVAVEAKAPGRRGEKDCGLSKNQVFQIANIDKAAGIVSVCDDDEGLIKLNHQLGRLTNG